MKIVGKDLPRSDANEKLTGSAKYIDDINIEGQIYAKVARARFSRGRILSITPPSNHVERGFTFLTAKDLKGRNLVSSVRSDLPIIASDEVRYYGQAVALIAHEDKDILEQGLEEVLIKHEPLPAIVDLSTSMNREIIALEPDNVFKTIRIRRGDPEKAFDNAFLVSEREYKTPHQEHMYIEPQGVIAYLDGDGVLIVKGSMQCPFYVNNALLEALELPQDRVSVQPTVTGGGFGGKEDYCSLIALQASHLTIASGRPVKLILDRRDDISFTTKRHPSIVKQKLGFSQDGKLIAAYIQVFLDAGAYETLSYVVLSRAVLHASGPYDCENVWIEGAICMTNTPPTGAFRGFGAPQVQFAVESHMDEVAIKLKMSPDDIRRKNIIKPNGVLPSGQVLHEDCAITDVLEQGLKDTDFSTKRVEYNGFNKENNDKKRGIGLSVFFHGSGFTGIGERYLASRAGLRLYKNGNIDLLYSSVDMGQGCNTVLPQIVAETLSIPVEMIRVAHIDTRLTPNSGPTVASRTTMIIGGLLKQAAERLKLEIKAAVNSEYRSVEEFREHVNQLLNERDFIQIIEDYQHPEELQFDERSYTGSAYRSYSWGCNIAEIEVSLDTYQVDVLRFYAIYDTGKVVNPSLIEGQARGGIVQGLGFALLENPVFEEGRILNNSFTDLLVYTSCDLPRIDVRFHETPIKYGPYGAQGFGELPLSGPPAAVNNALKQALGISFNALPILPELIYKAMGKRNG